MAKNAKSTETQVESTEDGLQFGSTEERNFKLATGSEVHEKYNGVELPYTVAGYGRTADECWQNILGQCEGETDAERALAAVDTFNSALALAKQKKVKTLTAVKVTKGEDGKEVRVDPSATVDELASTIRDFRAPRTQRKGAGDQQKKVEKQKASMFDLLMQGKLTMEQVRAIQSGITTVEDALAANGQQ